MGGDSRTKPAPEAGQKADGEKSTQEQDAEGDRASSGLVQQNHPAIPDGATLEELRAARQKELDEYRASVSRRAAERDRAQDAEVRALLDEIAELKNSIAAGRSELTKSRASSEKELRELDEKIIRLQKKLEKAHLAHHGEEK